MNHELTRRSLLKGVSLGTGATLLTPFLSQLAAHAAGDDRTAKQKRVVFVVQSNGMNPEHLVPVGVKRRPDGRKERPTNNTLEELNLLDHTLHTALDPLAPFKERMALVQGLSGRVAVSDHSANHGALGAYQANRGALKQTIDSAISEGHHPSLYEWPVVLLGNLGGKLKTEGRYLQFPNYGTKNHRKTANLYCTLLHAVGKPCEKFGTSDPGLKDIDQDGIISALLA